MVPRGCRLRHQRGRRHSREVIVAVGCSALPASAFSQLVGRRKSMYGSLGSVGRALFTRNSASTPAGHRGRSVTENMKELAGQLARLVDSHEERHRVTSAFRHGDAQRGPAASGSPPDGAALGERWSTRERGGRFRESVELLDRLPTGTPDGRRQTTFADRYYAAIDARLEPGCVHGPGFPSRWRRTAGWGCGPSHGRARPGSSPTGGGTQARANRVPDPVCARAPDGAPGREV